MATELRDIRRKIEKLKSMPVPIYWDGFQLPAARWTEYHKALTTRPKLYDAVERAYVAANDVNEAVNHRRTVARGKTIGVNPADNLDAAYDAAGAALDALGEPRGEPFQANVEESVPESIPDPPAVHLTPYERLEILYAEGQLLQQELEPSDFSFNIDRVITGANRVAKWTTSVSKEVKLVASAYYGQWVKAAVAEGEGVKALRNRLEALGAILSQLKGGDV